MTNGRDRTASCPFLIPPPLRVQITTLLKRADDEENRTDRRDTSSTDHGPAHFGAGTVRLQFPASTETLLTDPAHPVLAALWRDPGSIVWATSTQVLLCLLHESGGQHERRLQQELLHLVWEQPAELDLVRHHARLAGLSKVQSLPAPLARSQADGVKQRRNHEFRSLLPR